MSRTTTFEQLARARPYRPSGERPQHSDDAQRLLQRLRERGAEGITTGELIREGCCGLRPPNRVLDLRKKFGHLIETVREANGVFRYRLIRENLSPNERSGRDKCAKQSKLPTPGDWFSEPRRTGLPLFDSAVRS